MTDQSQLDESSRQAVDALAHRVRQRDQADIRQDPELFALEYVTAMRGRGWRPTPAAKPKPWRVDLKRGADPATHAEEIAAARARCAEATKQHKDKPEATP